jgi:hypothetical protein
MLADSTRATKRCSCCAESRPLEDFARHRKTRDRRDVWCRACRSVVGRASRFRAAYGLTVEQYDCLLVDQAGVCAICGQPERETGRGGAVKRLAVDHDHHSGRVRGLLCTKCNTAIGSLRHDPARLLAAVAYLTRM